MCNRYVLLFKMTPKEISGTPYLSSELSILLANLTETLQKENPPEGFELWWKLAIGDSRTIEAACETLPYFQNVLDCPEQAQYLAIIVLLIVSFGISVGLILIDEIRKNVETDPY